VSADLAALTAFSLVSLWIQFVRYDGVPPAWVGSSLLSFGLWFALGMGLAVISVALRGDDGAPRRPLGAGGAAACWGAAITLYVVVALTLPVTFVLVDVSEQLAAFLSFGAISLLLLIPAVLGPDARGVVARFLMWRPVAWIGLISYGVFLWHIVVIRKLLTLDVGWTNVTLMLATVAVTIPIAALSYYLVERPLLRFKYRRAERVERAKPSPAGRAA
jgi:peptidoglycan/LPS O-acetylase OafA/YrhL